MAYYIKNITNHTLEANKKYFFDANVWFFIVNPRPNPTRREQAYLDFFNYLQSTQIKPKPKVVVTGLVMSEVINRYLRSIALPKFIKENPTKIPQSPKDPYKDGFRPTLEFKTEYEFICYQIKSYHKYVELVNDELDSFKFKDLLNLPPQGLDFNDHYYYRLAKKKGYSIVTDDKDFFVEDVEILTYNKDLLDRASTITK